MKIKETLQGLKPYQPGKSIDEVKKELGLEKIVKLASNENPFGCSPLVTEKLATQLGALAKYPDGYAQKLRTKLSKKLTVEEGQLIFGNGSDEIVQIICRTFLQKNTNTVLAGTTFPQYKHNAVIEGADIREIPLVDGYHDLSGMLNAIDEDTRVVWLCSPNNPTGSIIKTEPLLDFLTKCPKHVLVVVDEAYYEYVSSDDFPDTIPLLKEHDNLIVLRTFSKAYGLAALRIGYGISNKRLIEQIEPAREPFNTSALAQLAADYALDDQSFIDDTKTKNIKNRNKLSQFCDEAGLRYFDSEANFLLIHLPINGDDMFTFLLKKGYIVRSGVALGIPNSIRVTIGNDEDTDGIIAGLKERLQV